MKTIFSGLALLVSFLLSAQQYRLALYKGTEADPSTILGKGRHIRLVLDDGSRLDGKISSISDSTFVCEGKTISLPSVRSVSYRGRARAGDALLVAGAFTSALGFVTLADEQNVTTPSDKAIDRKIEGVVFPTAALLLASGLYIRLHWVVRPLRATEGTTAWRLGVIRFDFSKKED